MGSTGGTSAADDADGIEDVLDDLAELEDIVDSDAERERVRETMRTARRVRERGVLGGFTSRFESRDAGEALVGSFVFGIPMVVEDGTLAIGRYIAGVPLFFALTLGFGVLLTLGILHAGQFERVEADLLFGVVPVRLVGILGIALVTAVTLMTIWGRVDWATPLVAAGQTSVTAVVMAVGAAIGDVLPE